MEYLQNDEIFRNNNKNVNIMDLNDCFERTVDFLHQLGWFLRKENDYRQVEMMNYACPFDIIITGLAYDEIAFECITPVRPNFTRFHKEFIQNSIAKSVIDKIDIPVSSIEWIAEVSGDIRWILTYTYDRDIEIPDVKSAISNIISLANMAWAISKKKCNLSNLFTPNGFVLPTEHYVGKMYSIGTAIKFLEVFNYCNIDRIVLGTFIYNTPFRLILRKKGIDFLIDYICSQEPELSQKKCIWDNVRILWRDLHYIFGPYDVKLINTFDNFHILGADIGGLNETLELLEYNTTITEMMFPVRWDRKRSSYMSPILGESVGHSPNYEVYLHRQKNNRDDIHIAQYWDFPKGNPILLDNENYSLCMFNKNSITMEHVLKMRKILKNASNVRYETLEKEQLPALCYVHNKPYMMLITECQNK